MLAESSGVAIELDLDRIAPPRGVSLERWLKTFPSYGYLITASPEAAPSVLELFAARDLHAAVIGAVAAGSEVALTSEGLRAVVRDHAAERLLGLGARRRMSRLCASPCSPIRRCRAAASSMR